MVKILQRPKQILEEPETLKDVRAATYEEIQNQAQKNEIPASIYHGGLTDMLTALNETTKAITGFERLLRSLSEKKTTRSGRF